MTIHNSSKAKQIKIKTELSTKINTPHTIVKNTGELIAWEYSKLITRAAGIDKNHGFTISMFSKPKSVEIDPSNLFDVDRDDRVAIARKRGRCVYCGATEDLSADDIIPLIRVGPNPIHNEVPCCKTCKFLKENNDVYEWYYPIKNNEISILGLSKYVKLVPELLGSEGKLDRFGLNRDDGVNTLNLGYKLKPHEKSYNHSTIVG